MVLDRTRASSSQRATLACEYCREKKLRCDGAKPVCRSCKVRGQRCVPQSIKQQPRPTNRRIKELEDENRRLLQLLSQGPMHDKDSSETTPTTPDTTSATAHYHEGQAIEGAPSSCADFDLCEQHQHPGESESRPSLDAKKQRQPTASSPAEAPQNRHTSYHGPTSVLFDEISRVRGSQDIYEQAPEEIEQARCRLIAETARQRQLEIVNVLTDCLDFDGVEPEIGMQLLSIFWARQLHAGLIVYRTAFMRDMVSGGPYFSKLLLNAMYYSVSKHCPSTSIRQDATDRATAGWSFRQRFDQLLRDLFDKTHITTIQALLIMACSLFTRCDERSVSWLYAGNAFNMIIDAGIHVEPASSKSMSTEDIEIRRRVYWGAFMIDKVQCLYQGRHPCLQIRDTNVPLVFLDDYEELEKFDTTSFCEPSQQSVSPSYHMTTLRSLCRLSIIMERVHSKIYAVSQLAQTSEDLCKDVSDLQLELEAWRQGLPRHLDLITASTKSNPLPYNLGMLAVYNVLLILVHRLLLFESALSSGPIASQALFTCCKAASEITHILRMHEKLYNPLSETFSLCYAAYIGATIQIHILAQHGDQFAALESLRVCLGCLDRHQAIYSAAKRARIIIARLMERVDVRICENGTLLRPCQPQNSANSGAAASFVVNQGPVDGAELRMDAQGCVPDTPLVGMPSFDSLDFDAEVALEYFRKFQDTSESRLGVEDYPLFYDLYYSTSPQQTEMDSALMS